MKFAALIYSCTGDISLEILIYDIVGDGTVFQTLPYFTGYNLYTGPYIFFNPVKRKSVRVVRSN